MKKFLAMLLLAALLATCLGTALASKNIRFIGNTNIRSGPSKGYAIKGVAKKGSKLTCAGSVKIDSRGVAWYSVKYGGTTRWVSSRYGRLADADYQKSGSKVKATSGNTYVRKTPSKSGTKLGVLKKGNSYRFLNSVSVDSRGVAWYAVSMNGKIGWVSSKYTKVS